VAAATELRDIEIFLTPAEELHFGRTAQRLRVTPARVSQAIKKQERRVGAPLFDRSPHHVALTPIGQQLRADLQTAYQLIRNGIDTAAATARGPAGTLSLGTFVNHREKIAPVIEMFRQRHPQCELRIREITFNDPFGPLRTGHVDIALLWLPVREPDLTVGPVVYTEPLVLAVAATHPLAARDTAEIEDLAELTVPVTENPVPDYWTDAHTPRTTPAGRPIHRGQVVASLEEALTVADPFETAERLAEAKARAVAALRPDARRLFRASCSSSRHRRRLTRVSSAALSFRTRSVIARACPADSGRSRSSAADAAAPRAL